MLKDQYNIAKFFSEKGIPKMVFILAIIFGIVIIVASFILAMRI